MDCSLLEYALKYCDFLLLQQQNHFCQNHKYQQAAFKTWFEEDVTTGKDDTSVLHEDRCRPAPKSVHKLFAMWCAKNVKPMMVDRGRKMRFGEAMKSMQGVELKNSGKTHRGVIKKMNDSRKSDNSDSYFSGIIAIKGYGNKPILDSPSKQ